MRGCSNDDYSRHWSGKGVLRNDDYSRHWSGKGVLRNDDYSRHWSGKGYLEPGMNGDPNVGNDFSNIGNQG